MWRKEVEEEEPEVAQEVACAVEGAPILLWSPVGHQLLRQTLETTPVAQGRP